MATIVTGQYAREVGIFEEQFDTLPDDAVTMAERLQKIGYKTLGVTSNPNTNSVFGYAQGFDIYQDSNVVWKWMNNKEAEKSYDAKQNPLVEASDITNSAIKLLESEVVGSDKPFFMQLLYIDPHMPYNPPKKHLKAMKKAGSKHPGYDGGIRYADAEIGRFLQALEDRGLRDNTMVIVTSDHGEGLDSHPNTPNSKYHGTQLYDSTIHVPMIINHASLPPHRVKKIASSISLVPTVMDLLGAKIPEGELPGLSAAPLVREQGGAGLPEKIYAETDWRENRKVAVRTASNKYIRNDDCKLYQETGAHEGKSLQDKIKKALTEVPPEEYYIMGNRAEDISRNKIDKVKKGPLENLQTAAKVWERKTESRPPLNRSPNDVMTTADGTIVPTVSEGEELEVDEATMESLRALGYMD